MQSKAAHTRATRLGYVLSYSESNAQLPIFPTIPYKTRKPYTTGMDELTIGDKIYISSKSAAKLTGYAKDYVGQLCREGRVEARLVGRNWYVLEASIREHRFGAEESAASPAKSASVEQSSPVAEWNGPEYFAEVPALIPVLSLKPEPQEAVRSTVVADMQSAWHEWFAEKKPEPEESTELIEETPAEEMVHITRIEEPEVLEEEEAIEEPEVVAMTRIKEPVVEEQVESPIQHEEYVEHVVEQQPTHETVQVNGGIDGSSTALKSLFVALSLVAVAVAVVGTGHATLLPTGGVAEVAQPLMSYLEGTSTYEHPYK